MKKVQQKSFFKKITVVSLMMFVSAVGLSLTVSITSSSSKTLPKEKNESHHNEGHQHFKKIEDIIEKVKRGKRRKLIFHKKNFITYSFYTIKIVHKLKTIILYRNPFFHLLTYPS